MLVSSCSKVYSDGRIDDQSVVVSQVSTAAAVSGKISRSTINSSTSENLKIFCLEFSIARSGYCTFFKFPGLPTLTSTSVNNC